MMRRFFLTCLLTFSATFAFGQGKAIQSTIYADSGELSVPVYRVFITGDSDLAAMAKRAFSLHGSFNQVAKGSSQFVFEFTKAGANAVRATIRGGTVYDRVVSASSLKDALLKACDVVVKKTIGSEGFFSGTLVFVYNKNGGDEGEICVSDMLFKRIRPLTNDRSVSLMPHFSPDGNRVMYTGYFRSGFMDLLEIDLRSRSRRVFASFKGSNTGGAFSPNGSKVAMILTSSGNAEVWTANSNMTGFRRITRTKAVESSASFSPDGSKLIFASDTMGGPQIYICSSAGGSMKRVATGLSRYCSEPVWNKVQPNLIAFTAAVGRGFQIGVYDFNKRSAEWVTKGASSSNAVWLNDGRHLVCAKAFGKKRRLYVVDTATKKEAPLHTASFGSVREPDFVYIEK